MQTTTQERQALTDTRLKNTSATLDRLELDHLRKLAASLKNSQNTGEWMDHVEPLDHIKLLREDLVKVAKQPYEILLDHFSGAAYKKMTAGNAPAITTPPSPGQHWPAQGGTYLGIATTEGNLPARHLVAFHADAPKKLNWKDGTAYAESFGEGTRLMTQLEAMLAYITCKAAFKPGTYWTGTQASSSGAFAQTFETGSSDWFSKRYEFLVLPVRGLSLHDFTPLPAQPVEKKAGSEQVAT